MREPQRHTIEGVVYEVTPLPAGEGLRVMAHVAKVLGPGAEKLTSLQDGIQAVLLAVGTVAQRLDPDALDAVCRTFAKHTTVQSGGGFVSLAQCFDLHFQANYLAMFEWLKVCMEVNFSPLLDGLKGVAARRAASAAAAR